MSAKTAEELTGRANRLGLVGTVHYGPTNGPGWRYQWCPRGAMSQGLGDSRDEARRTLWRMAVDGTAYVRP